MVEEEGNNGEEREMFAQKSQGSRLSDFAREQYDEEDDMNDNFNQYVCDSFVMEVKQPNSIPPPPPPRKTPTPPAPLTGIRSTRTMSTSSNFSSSRKSRHKSMEYYVNKEIRNSLILSPQQQQNNLRKRLSSSLDTATLTPTLNTHSTQPVSEGNDNHTSDRESDEYNDDYDDYDEDDDGEKLEGSDMSHNSTVLASTDPSCVSYKIPSRRQDICVDINEHFNYTDLDDSEKVRLEVASFLQNYQNDAKRFSSIQSRHDSQSSLSAMRNNPYFSTSVRPSIGSISLLTSNSHILETINYDHEPTSLNSSQIEITIKSPPQTPMSKLEKIWSFSSPSFEN